MCLNELKLGLKNYLCTLNMNEEKALLWQIPMI